MKRWKWIVMSGVLLVLAVGICWLIWANKALEVNTYHIQGDMPDGVHGYRIAQVSDLHNAQMGSDNHKLLSALRQAEPDMIAITGDLIDSRRTDIDVAVSFVREAVKIAPCYYVTGNHESRIEAYPRLKEALITAGVMVLENQKTQIQHNGETITLVGLQDPDFSDVDEVGQQLSDLLTGEAGFVILLSHRPELMGAYADAGVDLVLSGHAHGGQVRLPFAGGVIAPGQGLFPEYDGGQYSLGGTQMVVSRGVGNSLFPLRVNNRPEVVLIELKTE